MGMRDSKFQNIKTGTPRLLFSTGAVPKKSQSIAQFDSLITQIVRTSWHYGSKIQMMDDTDRQLLSLLRDNARASVASLAKVLRVSRGTVQNRLSRLESDGTITGYTVRLRPQAEAHRIRAYMTLTVIGNRDQAVMVALRGDPAVSALHSTNGRWDIVAELQADSLEAFDRVLGRIRLLDGVGKTETSLLLSTSKL